MFITGVLNVGELVEIGTGTWDYPLYSARKAVTGVEVA
jgi:hypothetical protein